MPSALALQQVEGLRAAGWPLGPDLRRAWEAAVRLPLHCSYTGRRRAWEAAVRPHRAVDGHLPDHRPPPAWDGIGPLD